MLKTGEFYRSFWFFDEPVFLSLLYCSNIFFVKPLLINKTFFKTINFLGGILLFSYSFYLLFLLIVISYKPRMIVPLLGTAYYYYFNDFVNVSSFSDRVLRVQIFTDEYLNADLQKVLLGNGYNSINLIKHPSAGLLSMLYEVGIVGLFLYFLFIKEIFYNSYKIFFLFSFGLLIYEPNKQYIFFLTMISVYFSTATNYLINPRTRIQSINKKIIF
jgi:hypothetical protein